MFLKRNKCIHLFVKTSLLFVQLHFVNDTFFFFLKRKNKHLWGEIYCIVMDLQSMLHMYFISLPWFTNIGWHLDVWEEGRNYTFFWLLNCNIVDIICFLFSLIGTFCTGLWGGVCVRVWGCVCVCFNLFLIHSCSLCLPCHCLLDYLKQVPKFEKRKKKKVVKKKMFSPAAVNIFAWWNFRLTLSEFYQ